MRLSLFSKQKKRHPKKPGINQNHRFKRLTTQISHNPFTVVFSLLLLLVAIGTSGYMVIEGWSLLDALYMTAITVTTIGFGEVLPLSVGGRLFTIFLIAIGVIIASYTISSTIELFTSERFMQEVRNRRRRRVFNKIDKHCIICGFGRLGSSLAVELQALGTSVIVIDTAVEALQRCQVLGIPALQGSGFDDKVLREAGIERAISLVAATKTDADNVFIILTASRHQPQFANYLALQSRGVY